ncbi:MAG TPA: hypothetical protein P5571_14040 [Candidatus Krumholzibacteria bacterium]|nr:hypothetical protein [Candidatus Krumholzibacteria bacterium]
MRSAPRLILLPLLLLTALNLAGCGDGPVEPSRDWMVETIFDSPEIQVLLQDDGYLIRMTGAYYQEYSGGYLDPRFETLLDRFGEVFPRLDHATYKVNVHTGSIHIDPVTTRYSVIHASEITSYLHQVPGGEAATISFDGHGGYFPLVVEDTPEAEAVNRRIDIEIMVE